MRAIILAGGFGTRLRERVSHVPKPMAPIAGRPFLEYQLDILQYYGITDVVLSIGYMAEKIIGYFGERYRNINLTYVVEDTPLGTGGAIKLAMTQMEASQDEDILVLNGDTFLQIDLKVYMDWYKKASCDMGMVLRAINDASRYGSVKYSNGKVSGFQEKEQSGGGLINSGIYIISPQILSSFTKGQKFSIEEEVLQKFHDQIQIGGFICDGVFLDVGTPEDFDRAQTLLVEYKIDEK